MKTKTNKEIIEEFREKFVDKDKKYIVDYIDGKMVLGADIEKFILQALEQKEREIVEHIEYGKPLSSFIQWKGTDVCLDWFCEKGHQNHTDGDFVYEVICEFCKAKYKTGTSIILSNLKSEGK